MISVLLENVRSLHNVGSIFRTSDGAKVSKIFLTGITATPPHKDISKVALGADQEIPFEYFADPLKAIFNFKNESKKKNLNAKIIIAEITDNAILYSNLKLNKNDNVLLILGNENTGVSEELLEIADIIVKIPMNGVKESLNVSVSAGIILYELNRLLND